MTSSFLVVGITLPQYIQDEGAIISGILRKEEAQLFHIRKPEWPIEKVYSLLKSIPEDLHSRLKIHDHFELLQHFHLHGVHLNQRNTLPPEGCVNISKSLHDLKELEEIDELEYVTLSPIFDSISKPGYKSGFSPHNLAPFIKNKKVLALGGVTPGHFPQLMKEGFYGAALSGYFYRNVSYK